MAFTRTLRDIANKFFGKVANDNAAPSLQFTVTPAQHKRAGEPPMDNSVVEIKHGIPVSDPFRPLEDLDAPATATWVGKQNAKFEDYITGQDDSMKRAEAFMTEALDYDSHSLPSKYGKNWFRTFHKSLAAQSVVEVGESEEGPWRTLFDPNTLSQDGTVALSGWTPSADGKRVAYLVSEAGSDAQTLRIRDVETGQDLPDVIENCRFTSVRWDKGSSEGFHYTYPTHDGTRRNAVKHHTIGDAVANDKTLYEKPEENSFVGIYWLSTAKYEWATHYIGTDKNGGLAYRPFGSQEEFKELTAARTYTISPITELDDGKILAVTNKDAARGKLVKIDLANPQPENWQEIIPEHKTDVLNSAMVHKGKLFTFYTEDTADAVRVYTPEGQHLHNMPLPTQSVAGYARIQKDDDFFTMQISGWQTRGAVYRYDIEKNTLDFVRKGPAKHDMSDCIVERVHATSKDGTKVPMTIVRHPDTKLDGTAATILYGYGGFNVPLTPGYDSSIMHFVKSGGIYVQANLRGGGEFGEEWYNGGRLDKKQNVFDDFIACAEHLIEGKYTSNKRLVINGGSNGGLLTSATMLQRPDLFGAVITEVAVTDMFRFHLATYGAAWKSDYGDPDIKADFNVAAKYSPLHNVKAGAKYPVHLVKTADHDDRVVPWHSFKLVATLQAKSSPENVTLMRVEERAGHGAGKPTAKYIKDWAETFAFIEKSVGPVDQQQYAKKLEADAKLGTKIVQFVRKFKPGA